MKEKFLSLEDVEGIIKNRQAKMPEGSYVASLFKRGIDRIAQKVGEEGVETALAITRMGITGEGRKRVIEETADLWFHSLVALVALDIPITEVFQELTRRHEEKQNKGGNLYE